MILKVPVFIFFLFITTFGHSQFYKRSQIDSLEMAIVHQEGIPRINTALLLSESYILFQLDSARKYCDLARLESQDIRYEWGYCKSIFCLGMIKFQVSPIKEAKELFKESANWFMANDYEADGISSQQRYAICLYCLEGKDVARNVAIVTHERAKKTKNNRLIGKSWSSLMRFKPILLNGDDYVGSYDSARFYASLAKDSVQLFMLDLLEGVNMRAETENLNYLYAAQLKAKEWGNLKLVYSAFWYSSIAYGAIGNLDSVLHYNDKMNQLSQAYSKNEIRLNGFRNLAFVYNRVDSLNRALEYYNKAFQRNEKYGVYFDQSGLLRAVGYVQLRQKDYESSIKTLIRALEYSDKLGDKHNEYSTKLKLGELYNLTGQYEKGEQMCQDVILWADTALSGKNQKYFMVNVYNTRGGISKKQGRFEEALEYFAISNTYTEDIPYYAIANDVGILSIYQEMGDSKKVNSYFELITEKYEKSFLDSEEGFQLSKGELMVSEGRVEEGVKALERYFQITQSVAICEERKRAYFFLHKAYKELGRYESALYSFNEFKIIEDSLQSGRVIQNVAQTQADYEISLKEAQIKDLVQQKELSDLKLIQQNSQLELRQSYIFILISVFVFIGIIGYLLFRRFRLKKEMEMKTKSVELQLANYQTEQKAELAEVKNTIFANISHEFRTPLTLIQVPIKNHLEKAHESDRPMFNSVLNNTEDLLRMVDELLDLAKMKTGNVVLQKSIFNLDQFFTQIKSGFASLFKQKNIDFKLENTTDNLNFDADENRLKIVINNLLKNAFAHTPESGSVVCMVKVVHEYLVISVSNTGKTIPEVDIPHLFERYYRGSNEDYVGNGIGLTLSQQIVQLHGGKITVTNQGSAGVVFSIKLPGVFSIIDKRGDRVNETEKTYKTDQALPAAEKRNVLVVEDNAEMRNLLATVLSNDFNLTFSKNGEEGEKMAFENQPDLILSDVMMPKKDGFELLHSIKNNLSTSHIPIVLLTAKADMESRVSGLNQDADDYVIKPFSPDELKARIGNLLRQREKLQQLFTENPFLGTKAIKCTPLDAEFLNKARNILEGHFMDGDFTTLDFCEKLALNRNSVNNKIKAFTNQTTSEYVKNFRLEKAVQMLIGSNEGINNIVIDVGFNSPQVFNKAFKVRFKCTPKEYRSANRQAQNG